MHVAELQGFTVTCLVTVCAQGLPAFSATDNFSWRIQQLALQHGFHNFHTVIRKQLRCVCVRARVLVTYWAMGAERQEKTFSCFFFCLFYIVSKVKMTKMCEKVQILSGTLWHKRKGSKINVSVSRVFVTRGDSREWGELCEEMHQCWKQPRWPVRKADMHQL